VDEVRKAVEVAYALVDAYKFWKYSLTRLNNCNNSGDILSVLTLF